MNSLPVQLDMWRNAAEGQAWTDEVLPFYPARTGRIGNGSSELCNLSSTIC